MLVRDVTKEEIAQLYEEYFDEKFSGSVHVNCKIWKVSDGFVIFSKHGELAMIHFAAVEKNRRRLGIGYTQFQNFLQFLKDANVKAVDMVCRRNNTGPQIIALKSGFQIFSVLCAQETQLIFRKEL